ncbi:Protein of unknown function [Lactobacillus helveticus CIRM-BIA 101]|nr:Protein of unknown function [Lactobacillus helveticus CIRM-BIA 101]
MQFNHQIGFVKSLLMKLLIR